MTKWQDLYALKHLPLLQDEKRREGCFCQTLQLCVTSRGRQEKRAICRLPQTVGVSSAPVNILFSGNSRPLFLPHSPAHTAAWLSLPTNAPHFYHWAVWETILPFAYSEDVFSAVLLLLTTPFYPFTFLLSYCLLLLVFSLITIEAQVRQASQ